MASAKEKRRSARPDVQAIANKARDKIAKLTEYARAGDFQAALELYRATNLGVGFLTLLHTMNPEIIRKVAQDHKAWPVLFSPHRDSIEENKGFVEAIGLGCETGSSFA